MKKIAGFVANELTSYDREFIIEDYDEWVSTGSIGSCPLRQKAFDLGNYLYGENTKYGPPITTLMKDLYVEVCRFYVNQYRKEHRIVD